MATSQKIDIDLGITRYEYGEAGRARRAVLQIETGKYYNGGLISDAGVCWVGSGSRQSMVSLTGSGGDYGKRLRISERTVKATQGNINRQHAEVFTAETVEQLTRAAKAHYSNVIAAGVDAYGNTYPGGI